MKHSSFLFLGLSLLTGAVSVGAEVVPQAQTVQQSAVPHITTVRQLNSTTIEVEFSNRQMATIDFYGKNIFRLFRDSVGGLVRSPEATPPAQILVNNPRRDAGSVVLDTTNPAAVVISTDRLRLTLYRRTGLMVVTDLQRGIDVVEEALPCEVKKDKVSLTLTANVDEYFYGGGVQNGRFSHRAKSIAIENTNNWVDGGVASPTPFYWSTRGYGVFFHTFKPGRYDFGETEPKQVQLTHADSYLDVFFMVDDQPEELLADFYQLTGNPVLLPKFAFYQGHLNAYNRDYWKEDPKGTIEINGKKYVESQKDNGGIKESLNGEKGNYPFSARAAIDRYVNNDMPLGWFLPNDGYGAGYGQTESLDGNVANLREFTDYAHSKGVEVGLWTQSDLHPKEGIEPLLQRDIVKEVRDAGVRVLKTDVAWVGAGYSFGLNGVADVATIMPTYGNEARPFIISLDGWAGTQRYAGIWTGDQTGGDWEYIRFHIPTFIGSGLSGQPNITSDVDGIFGGRNKAVNIREFQWKTFTPMELNMDGWGSSVKYPDAFDAEATAINRSYLKLKSRLMPYVYTAAKEAVTGRPMIRPMFLEEPTRYTYGTATQYQFMYGPSLLVAPIYKDDFVADSVNVRNGIYLPNGRWVDYFTGKAYDGGRVINNLEAPLWYLPVFAKADAILPMTTDNNSPAFMRKDYRAYDIYAYRGTAFTEYDDDGRTQAYLRQQGVTTDIATTVDKERLTIRIAPTKGTFSGFEPQKATELFVHTAKAPKKVKATVGSKRIQLTEAKTRAAYDRLTNAFFYDAQPAITAVATGVPGSAPVKGAPQLFVKLDKTNTATEDIAVEVRGFQPPSSLHLRTKKGFLSAPKPRLADAQATSLALAWDKQAQADFYEVEFDGILYSTIRHTPFTFDNLSPEHSYAFKVRSVNADGYSPWADITVSTVADPLEHAVKGATAVTSCPNQGGQGVGKLVDRDEKSVWHTEWGKTDAVPFTLTLDLKGVNQLDRLVYLPREDAGNGTLLAGTYATSTDKLTWNEAKPFLWARDGKEKTLDLTGTAARYLRFNVTAAVGGYGSGRELYVFRVPGSEVQLQGDINRDKRIDENDLTSYMNYTGLRRGDADFDYVSIGDINRNGLIDAYDISTVATQLDGGVRETTDKVAGALTLTPNRTTFAAGDEVRIAVKGRGLHIVNALSFALPYEQTDLEFLGLELQGMKNMVNLTYDRLHTNGQKALYPTFVNRGNEFLLEGDADLFVLRFRAKRNGRFTPKAIDTLLVDRSLGTAKW